MKCSLLTLSCALDGELPRERQLELDSHLVTCDRCKTGMRYLREETERISQLAPVQLGSDTATALLERAHVLVTITGPASLTQDDDAEDEPMLSAPDPFGALGIGAALLEPAINPATSAVESAPAAAHDAEDVAGEAAGPLPVGTEPGSTLDEEAGPAGGLDEELAVATPESAAPEVDTPVDPGADEDLAPASDELPEPLDQPSAGDPELGEDQDDAAAALDQYSESLDQGSDGDDEFATTAPGDGLAASPLAHGSAFQAAEADLAEAAAIDEVTEEDWLADPPGSPPESVPTGGRPSPESTPPDPEATGPEPPVLPGADGRPTSVVVPGWEPATELNMPWADIPAATPAADTWSPELTGVPVPREAPMPPPAPFPAAPPPTRPAAAAVPAWREDRKEPDTAARLPQRTSGGGPRRPMAPQSGAERPGPRSWTRTGLIAVAALAAVLIIWDLTHSSQPALVHHPRGQATPAVSAKPTPSATATPSATPTPLALTGAQTVGGGGSGYQMQTARYGVHGSQFWVVFQMVQGSGSPQVTTGFDGTQTIYVEMQGVAPGTAVPQPAAGTVVSSISVGHVSGFNGAVYVLHLTRAAQFSPELLPGTETGGPGERYLLILQ
ncbi:MAG: hypothetical protein ACREN1_03520 [Candidatus Dormibacteria bacterium]